MPLPVIIPAIASMLAWVGIDLGISWLTQDDSGVEYVSGLDFQSFLGIYWLPVLLYSLLIITTVYLAIPKQSNNGREVRI